MILVVCVVYCYFCLTNVVMKINNQNAYCEMTTS
jgi:hypothetical protein